MRTKQAHGNDLLKKYNAEIFLIPHVEKAPWLDGKLDDACWKQAASFKGFKDVTPYLDHLYNVTANNPLGFTPEPVLGPAEPGARVFLCHDGRNLYAAFVCYDKDIGDIRRRDHGFSTLVDREDCVYVWVDAHLQHVSPYVYEYIVNVAGQKSEFFQGRYSGGYDSLMAWEGKAALYRDRWIMELMIPLERLGLNLQNNPVFGFNAGRGYRGDWRTHALLKPDGHYRPGYGYAVLCGKKAKRNDRGMDIVRRQLEHLDKLNNGRTLWRYPGSVINMSPHRDDNGMVGSTVWGPDHQPTISVGRSDSYDRRWYGNEGRPVTRKDVVEAAMSGAASRLDELRRCACGNQYGAYSHFPSPKPVGQIIFMLPGGQGMGWRTEATKEKAPQAWQCACGSMDGRTDAKKEKDHAINVVSRCRKGMIRLRIYVHKKWNMVVVEGDQSGFTGAELKIRLYRHQDNPHTLRPMKGYDYDADEKAGKNVGVLPPPQAGRAGGMIWLRQKFFPDATFPDGFEILLAGQVHDVEVKRVEFNKNQVGLGTQAVSPYEGWETKTDCHLACQATHFRHLDATPGSAVTLHVRMKGSRFRALFPTVSTNDGRATVETAVALLRETSRQSPELLEAVSKKQAQTQGKDRYRYQQRVGGVCGVFDGKFVFDDITPWHGDYHFNEFVWHPCFIEGNLNDFEPYFQMVEANLPAARRLAREAFGCRGAAWGVASFPMKFKRLPMTSLDWDYNIECTGLVIQPFWLMYLYTMDRAFLDKRAYPAIKEAALFYADYVTLEKDGRYHIRPCTSGEHVTLQPYLKYNKDSQAALTMAKFILKAAVEGSRLLKRDRDLVKPWQKIVDRLAPYPTEMTPEGPRLVDVADARLMTEYNQAGPFAAIAYGDDIGLASSKSEREIPLRSRAGIVRYSTAYHWNHVYRVMKLLGKDPGSPMTCENLIQSHQGPIFLFPAVPENFTGEFQDYRARGAFLVSAAMVKGRIKKVRIQSLAGMDCRVDVAGFASIPRVKRVEDGMTIQASVKSKRTLCFPTLPGSRYELCGM